MGSRVTHLRWEGLCKEEGALRREAPGKELSIRLRELPLLYIVTYLAMPFAYQTWTGTFKC